MSSINLIYLLMKISFNWHCTLKSMFLIYNYYFSYYNIMILRSLHIYLYIYYFYCYAFYCSKQSVFILESGNFNCSNNTTAHNEEIHINHDICSINAGGLIKKILYPMVNYFNGKVENMQMIDLLTLVRIQITLTGQNMTSVNLIYSSHEILPNWYCTSQLLSFLYNYYLPYYYSIYLRLLYNWIFNYYCCNDYAINCAKYNGFEHESS